jgi:inner membrane protein
MENKLTPFNLFERIGQWIRESIMIKLLSIGFLVLILLIPSAWIEDIVNERQSRADDAMREVTSKWSGDQTLSGPILIIPYKWYETIDHGKLGTETHEHTDKAYFLPQQLNVDGSVTPQILHRGIFDAAVYESNITVKSVFNKPDFKSLNIAEENVLWKDAYLAFGITNLRGMGGDPSFNLGGKSLSAEPSNDLGIVPKVSTDNNYAYSANTTTAGIVSQLDWETAADFTGDVSMKLNLKGSNGLKFIPVGKTTTVNLSGPWSNPSFDGEFLPDTREVTETNFTASWKILHFNRPFPQQWTNSSQNLDASAFGVNLLVPVDQYQMSMRTSKYGVLIIMLTFIALFLVEILKKIRIHPFQYILIGAALIIYYTLLLSFSEHIGFNLAYIISSVATIVLVGLYSTSFLKTGKLTALFTALLAIFYLFIYVIILQQDFSLLFGSIGLFVIIGALMFFSRKITWYKEGSQSTVGEQG